jgi:hypothetical protein
MDWLGQVGVFIFRFADLEARDIRFADWEEREISHYLPSLQ